jgi:hypothetical protein
LNDMLTHPEGLRPYNVNCHEAAPGFILTGANWELVLLRPLWQNLVIKMGQK